jgi:hypothetical protein
MKKRYLSIAVAATASLALNVAAQTVEGTAPDESSAVVTGQAATPTDPSAMPPEQAVYVGQMMSPEQMQQAQEMRQQRMEMMRSNPGAMPMMGRGFGMMDPQMRQQMEEMRRQHMQQMMQMQAEAGQSPDVQGRAMPPGMMQPMPQASAGPGAGGATGMPGGCGGMGHYGHGAMGQRQEMKKQMMEEKQQHWQAVEQRLANIEELMREMVEQQKAK